MSELERDLQARVIEALTLYLGNGARGYVDRRDAGSVSRRHRSRKAAGVPDLMVVLARGRVCWIELKRKGRTSNASNPETVAAQAAWKARALRLGHAFAVVDDVAQAVAFVSEVMSR